MKFKKGDKIVFVKEIGLVMPGDKFEITGIKNTNGFYSYTAIWKTRHPNHLAQLGIKETDRCAILSTLQLEFDM